MRLILDKGLEPCLRSKCLQAKARKAEGQRRLDDLEKDINALDSISTDQVKAERDAAAELLQVVKQLVSYTCKCMLLRTIRIEILECKSKVHL